MKAIVKRVRIWDGRSPGDGFGEAVLPFIARVHLVDSSSPGYELTILSPEEGKSVVVVASSILVEAAWKEFVHKTEFDGQGHAGDVAERFAAYLNDEAPKLETGAPTPYS
jgi:hypothetical protein